MAYVITDPCIGCKDTACADACPVNCIHPNKSDSGFSESSMLFINPLECILCGACLPVCPVNAIYEDAESVPAHQKDLAQANAIFRVGDAESVAKAETLVKAHIAANPTLMALPTDKRRASH